jgi:cellulose synthase/poly-beta-1,6-N-acetylglucosamine synthase-like glycosyltransferase
LRWGAAIYGTGQNWSRRRFIFVPRGKGYFPADEQHALHDASVLDAPVIPLVDLIRACRSLRIHEIPDVLRRRYLPIRHLSPEPFAAAADAHAMRAGSDAGFAVMARLRRAELTLALQHVFGKILIGRAESRLARHHPAYSAGRPARPWQKFALAVFMVQAGFISVGKPEVVFVLAAMMFSLVFLAAIAVRLLALTSIASVEQRRSVRLTDQALPIYTIFVPLFREAEMVPRLLRALSRLDYPADRLDIKIILEENDHATRDALNRFRLMKQFEVIIVPAGGPQTKPRALSYALHFARGELATVFDAEDVPNPQQLRQAAGIFAAGPPRLACLQARLTFAHASNWLSRHMLIEYAALFDVLLPVLGQQGWPIPLGGTSNHFRVDILRKIGGWDPFNVTEDADLGIRLARCGFAVDVFSATTVEEANTSLSNWMRQRSRWIKGWLQTAIVHTRHPARLYRELGFTRFAVLHLQLISMVASPLVHPFFLGLIGWKLLPMARASGAPDALASLVLGFGAVVFIAGYGVAMATQVKGIRLRRLDALLPLVATLPFYWLLISAASWMAVWEFIRRPYHWNKTEHGLTMR